MSFTYVESIMTTLHRYSFRLVFCILFLIVGSSYLRLSYSREGIHDDLHQIYGDIQQIYRKVRFRQKQAFIGTAIQTEIDGPFDYFPIRHLCASKNWTEGLITACVAPQGGVGNVRNVFLNCVRYAIEAGAALVVPQLIARSESDLRAITTNNVVDFSHFFDQDHFIKSLQRGCPQMKVYHHRNELYNLPSTAKTLLLSPQDLSKEFHYGTVLAHPSNWRKDFDEWIYSNTTPLSRKHPILVEFNCPLLQFPLSYDSPAFVHNFGRILKFRSDASRLAAAVLFELSQKFSLNLGPDYGIVPDAFMGAHLRTEIDANAAGWLGYNTQADIYIQQAESANLSTIYVTSGHPPDIIRFREQASKNRISVTTKHDLLFGNDLGELGSLTWDQQALVDYEVLLKSSSFGGVVESSFAWNIALRRNRLSQVRDYDYLNGAGGQSFEDGLSWLYGTPGRLTLPAYSMWP